MSDPTHDAAFLLASLRFAGFTVSLGTGKLRGSLVVDPGSRLTSEQRADIVAHKPALLKALATELPDDVIDALAERALYDNPFNDRETATSPSVILRWEGEKPLAISKLALDQWKAWNAHAREVHAEPEVKAPVAVQRRLKAVAVADESNGLFDGGND